MIKLKNTLAPVDVYAPAGDSSSVAVDNGQVLVVAGDLAQETEDAYVIGTGDEVLAWPKSRWELVPESGSNKSGK